MTAKQFKNHYYKDILAACKSSGLNPLFVAAQAALETGWGKAAIGNNLFGITAGKQWKGATKIVTTTEILKDKNQGGSFLKVHSIVELPSGRYRYSVDRAFRDYPSVADCLRDHFKVLSLPRYKEAFNNADDIYLFAYQIAHAGYCTADPKQYATTILSIAKKIEKL